MLVETFRMWRKLGVKALDAVMMVGALFGLVLFGSWIFSSLGIGNGTTAPASQPNTLSAADMTATLCSIATSQAGDYVLIYDLWGTPTPTPVRSVVPLATSTPTPVVVARALVGDPTRGERVFTSSGMCNSCHRVTDNNRAVGPSLKGIARLAAEKKPDASAQDYLRGVVLNPDQNIIPRQRPGIMPRTYSQSLNAQQIEDLIAYLMTLE
jgi:mono/diheme cytochrome c family protein